MSDADCTPGREPRSVAASCSLYYLISYTVHWRCSCVMCCVNGYLVSDFAGLSCHVNEVSCRASWSSCVCGVDMCCLLVSVSLWSSVRRCKCRQLSSATWSCSPLYHRALRSMSVKGSFISFTITLIYHVCWLYLLLLHYNHFTALCPG